MSLISLTGVNSLEEEEEHYDDKLDDQFPVGKPVVLELQLQYESLLAEYRMMRFKLPLYRTQWNDVCKTRKLKSKSTTLAINYIPTVPVVPEEANDIRESLLSHIRQLSIPTSKLALSSCSSQDLVKLLVNHSLYGLHTDLKHDLQSFEFIVKTLQYFVDTVRSWAMWQYGNSSSAVAKQFLLEQLFEPTEFETNQHSYQQVIMQLGIVSKCKHQSEQDLKELMRRFYDLQSRNNPQAPKQSQIVDDIVDFIENDMHTMQLKQIEQTIKRYSVEIDDLLKQKEQLEQILPIDSTNYTNLQIGQY